MMRVLLALCVTVVVGGCASQNAEPRVKAHPAGAVARHLARTGPTGEVPPNAIWEAKLHRDAMLRDKGAGAGDGPGWTWIGPGNVGGRIRSILIHPANPDVMWVGAVTGGVWKTTNAGQAWAPLNDFVPSLTVGCMAMDPNNPDVLYAGTGEGFFDTIEGTSNTAAPPGAGVFKSTDGGQTWSQIPATATADWKWVNRLWFAPGSSTVMLAATGSGIWRTTNAGQSWTQAATGQFYDVKFHPTNPSLAVAGGHDLAPHFSTNGGVSWTAAPSPVSHRVEVEYAPGNPSIVYAAVADASRLKVYRSTNGGQTYTLMTSGTGISTLSAYTGVIWVDPNNSDHVLMGGQQMFRSTNGGVTLTQTFSGVHADHHIIVNHPGYNGTTNKIILMGNDGGIYRATDSGGSSATALNNNLGITQFYGAAIHDGSGVAIGGTQDNGTKRYAGQVNGWTSVIGGDGGFCASDPTNSSVFYGETQRLAIRRSTNGGTSFSSITSGLSDTGTLDTNFIPFFMLDPNESNRMYAAAKRLWRANNVRTGNPPTWTIVKPPIGPPFAPPAHSTDPRDPSPAHFSENSPFNISTIAVAEGNPDIVWVGYNNGHVAMTTNGTAASPTWVRVDENGVGLPDRWVSRIVIDPANHLRVYVALLGYHSGNIWRTADGGKTWESASGSGAGALPAVPAAALALHASGCPRRLYAGTDIGLFVSSDDGASWSPVTPGVGLAPVEELVWRNAGTLMAVTHGRGLYLGDIPTAACYPDCNGDCVLNLADFGCFQTRFALADPYADCNGDGQLNLADFGCFTTKFALGCP